MSHLKRRGEGGNSSLLVIFFLFYPCCQQMSLPIHADFFSGLSFCPWATVSHVVDCSPLSAAGLSHTWTILHCITKLSELVFQLGLEHIASYLEKKCVSLLIVRWLRFIDKRFHMEITFLFTEPIYFEAILS